MYPHYCYLQCQHIANSETILAFRSLPFKITKDTEEHRDRIVEIYFAQNGSFVACREISSRLSKSRGVHPDISLLA